MQDNLPPFSSYKTNPPGAPKEPRGRDAGRGKGDFGLGSDQVTGGVDFEALEDRISASDRTGSDEELMVAFAAGGTSAFTILFDRYRQPLFGFFGRRIADQERAEELTQETFLAVLRAAERYEPTAKFRTWIYAIAFKILRAERSKGVFRGSFHGAKEEAPEAATQPTQDVEVMMRHAVDQLDRLDREVLLLREFEQLSYTEIATLLEIPLNTVRSRLFRARLALQTLLAAPHTPSQTDLDEDFESDPG
jgi:RNA polymerase sigma-70 factor, ECF subfamily